MKRLVRRLGSERHSPGGRWEGRVSAESMQGQALVGSCGQTEEDRSRVTRVCGRTEERDARRCQPEPSRSRAASELVHWSRERVGSPRAAAELHVASSLPGSGHTETAAHPHRCHTHLPLNVALHVRRHASHMHIHSWSGKGFTASCHLCAWPSVGVPDGF